MDRRELLQLGAVTAALSAAGQSARAQGASAAKTPSASGFALDACSYNLQWLRTPQALGQGVIDLGLRYADLTVTPYPGHIDPAKAKTDLPAFVNALKSQGVGVRIITTPIVDADSPNAEAIVDAAASAGITHYVWGGLTYDETKPYRPQLDALKPRIEKLARMNEKYRIKGLYHPVAGAANVGSAFFDILELLRGFDPRHVAIQYDTASLLQPVRDVFVVHMRLGAPFIGAMALNDATVSLDLPVYNDGFFVGGTMPRNNAGDNTGTDAGNPLAIGGGGRPLPYHFHPKRVGMGMIDLTLIGKTLKAIGFDGPMETQVHWPLGGAENGADKITLPRQSVLGQIKRDRLTVEAGFFAGGWNIDILRPAFQVYANRRSPAGGNGSAGRPGGPR